MGLVMIKKPVEGSYNNEIINGSFVGSMAPWVNRDIEDIAWLYSGGLVVANGVSSPVTFTRKLYQHIPLRNGQSYDWTLTKVIASFDSATYVRLVAKKLGYAGEGVLLNSNNSADGSFPLSGTFVSNDDYTSVYFEVTAAAP